MDNSKKPYKKAEIIDIEKLKEEITEEEVYNIVFNDEKLTEICFDFIADLFGGIEENDDEDDYDDNFYCIHSCYELSLASYKTYNVKRTSSIKFPDYSNSRTLTIDGIVYNLDNLPDYFDEETIEYIKQKLLDIDEYCAELSENLETILKTIEELDIKIIQNSDKNDDFYICEPDYNDPEFLNGQFGVITGNYIEITDIYDIYPEVSFNFPDYSDCRTICVDGQCYELEEVIADGDESLKQDSKELLYEVDALCADLPFNLETILKKVEKRFSERIALEISDRNQ